MAYDFSSQLQTLNVIRLYFRLRGYAPTYQELGDLRGMSEMAVRRHVQQLVKRGYLYYATPRTWRNIRLVERDAA